MAEPVNDTAHESVEGAVGQPPSKATSLHEKVLDQLRDYIIEGNVEENARIPERKLCELFQISRTPLREALKVLASEGLVELLPNRGARLRALNEADIIATFDVIGGLEALAGQLACERISEAEYEEIEQLHHQMYKHYVRTELQEYFKYNRAIHNAIMKASRNPVLQDTYASLSTSMRRIRYTANLNVARDRWGEAMREHEAILGALHRRDGRELSDILFKHLRSTCASAVEWLAEERKAAARAAS
ncbi:GntR family transcriptional regulator [Labrys wisconsinensis]|uniref:DNA-binding GntR family transcriptional regulator n=1 Tax=Labrys wisconsinensis TaxID=425677 RepID=A0ABU0JAW0_9HYPH|nr:GntR family transcriptional regulator [Labrys wisconsinensis]MDQ0471394.1 DNA-binding GntR family transcriptional regulator [Labrys wisconsinensis]